ncbi:hypothetical protein F2P81_008651 [Scophthalmus maximus]|uniref:Uncharacterized protein n=1 Tax=Scophthalmus maximus TaxID=52904 RepID=A0A6A4SX75_SCOMX|nr:hypothetical protein F2P81_008651 [Scophthalmus maximus]
MAMMRADFFFYFPFGSGMERRFDCAWKHHRSDAGMRGNLSERDLERVADRPVCDYCARARLTSMKNEICNVEMWP